MSSDLELQIVTVRLAAQTYVIVTVVAQEEFAETFRCNEVTQRPLTCGWIGYKNRTISDQITVWGPKFVAVFTFVRIC